MNSKLTYLDIENKIRNGVFETKDELIHYLMELEKQGLLVQNSMIQLLELYDELKKEQESSLNLEDYKNVKLQDQKYIVSTSENKILKTMEDDKDIASEFKEIQNEMLVATNDAKKNADEVYQYMSKNQKQELDIIPMYEVFTKDNIDPEVLRKIRFFISNRYINPYSFRVNITDGIFYNMETGEMFEVRKNPDTQKYQIYKGGELIYGDVSQLEETSEVQEKASDLEDDELIKETSEEEQLYENRYGKNHPKTRTLKKPLDNSAFSTVVFLMLIIGIFALILIVIFLLDKFIK